MVGLVFTDTFCPFCHDCPIGYRWWPPRFTLSSLGLLTSLPLVMFALCSSFSPRPAQKFGLEKLFTMVLIVLTIGSLIRIINLLPCRNYCLGATIATKRSVASIIQTNLERIRSFQQPLHLCYEPISITVASALVVPITLWCPCLGKS